VLAQVGPRRWLAARGVRRGASAVMASLHRSRTYRIERPSSCPHFLCITMCINPVVAAPDAARCTFARSLCRRTFAQWQPPTRARSVARCRGTRSAPSAGFGPAHRFRAGDRSSI